MRPIPSPASNEAFNLLKRAQSLLEKAEKLDMVEHEGKKVPSFAADGKGAKDETKKGSGKCPSCGGKMDMEKGMCMKMGCMGKASVDMKKGSGKCPSCGEKLEKGMCKMGCMGKTAVDMKKGSQHKIQTFNTKPESTQFMIETGGNTYHQQYSTNNSLLDSEDVANKGASSSTVNLESLNRNQNPHDTPAPGHLTEG